MLNFCKKNSINLESVSKCLSISCLSPDFRQFFSSTFPYIISQLCFVCEWQRNVLLFHSTKMILKRTFPSHHILSQSQLLSCFFIATRIVQCVQYNNTYTFIRPSSNIFLLLFPFTFFLMLVCYILSQKFSYIHTTYILYDPPEIKNKSNMTT